MNHFFLRELMIRATPEVPRRPHRIETQNLYKTNIFLKY